MPDPLGEEFRRCSDGKIARHLPPNIVELIRLAPDIRARACDLVVPSGGVKLGRPFEWRSTDVIGTGKAAEPSGLGESRNG